MPWDSYLKEGFEALDRFQGEVIEAKFIEGENGIQLELIFRIDAVEEPPQEPPSSYRLWYSIGAKTGWVVNNNGANIWNANPEAGWTKTSKFGMLIQSVMDLNAPMVNSDTPPSEAAAWIGLNAIWQREELTYKGLTPTDITKPVQVLNAGVAVGVPVAAAVSVNGNGSSPSPIPQMAVPMSAPPAPAGVDLEAHWGANLDTWRSYVKQQVQGLSKDAAKQKLMSDTYCQQDSVVLAAVASGELLAYAERTGIVAETGGVLV